MDLVRYEENKGEMIGYKLINCWCGDTFLASGTDAEREPLRKAWQAEHADCKDKPRDARKVFWLSFCDSDRPTGQQFLGACLVEVTAAEAEEGAIDVMLRFPRAQPDSEWIAAAVKKAHALGCNPGGEVASCEVDIDNPNLLRYQMGVLMDKATCERIEAESD